MIWFAFSDDQWKRGDEEQQGDKKKNLPQGLGEGASDSFEAGSQFSILVVTRAQIEKKGLNCHGLWKCLHVDTSCCSTFPLLLCRKLTFPASYHTVP